MARKKDQTYTIIFQVESWNVSYHLLPKEFKPRTFLSDWIEVNAKVIFSKSKSIKEGDNILFRFSIAPVVDYNIKCPESYGSFNKSRKQRECFISTPNSFIERFSFLLNQGVKPYFDLNCATENYRTINIKSFSMHSQIDINDYIE